MTVRTGRSVSWPGAACPGDWLSVARIITLSWDGYTVTPQPTSTTTPSPRVIPMTRSDSPSLGRFEDFHPVSTWPVRGQVVGDAGVGWPLPEDLDDEGLERLLYPLAPPSGAARPMPEWSYVRPPGRLAPPPRTPRPGTARPVPGPQAGHHRLRMQTLRRPHARHPAMPGPPHVHDSRRDRRALPRLRPTQSPPASSPQETTAKNAVRRNADGRLPTSTQLKGGELRGQTPKRRPLRGLRRLPSENYGLRVRKRRNSQADPRI